MIIARLEQRSSSALPLTSAGTTGSRCEYELLTLILVFVAPETFRLSKSLKRMTNYLSKPEIMLQKRLRFR